MKGRSKTKQELVSELTKLQEKMGKLEESEARRKRVEKELKENLGDERDSNL